MIQLLKITAKSDYLPSGNKPIMDPSYVLWCPKYGYHSITTSTFERLWEENEDMSNYFNNELYKDLDYYNRIKNTHDIELIAEAPIHFKEAFEELYPELFL